MPVVRVTAVATSLLLAATLTGAAPALAAPATVIAPQGDQQATTHYSQVIATLTREIPATMQAAGAVGMTVALVDRDGVIWTRGFGWADREARRPATSSTLFHIGSASKTLSALAVMQLVERGLVDLDAPFARYVPGFALMPRYRGNVITVRTVLDHHSGIPGDVFNGLITARSTDPGYRAWLLQALRRMTPERPVNTLYAYNNSGYVLLQNLVEHVTGVPFAAYSREHLFAPMGMTSSTFDDSALPSSRMTANYQAVYRFDGTPKKAAPRPREYVNGWTAGSVLSNARDMAQYALTMLRAGQGGHGRVVGARTLASMWRAQVAPPLDIAPFRFGLGFGLHDPALDWAGPVVWHDGATVWNHTMFKLLPAQGLGVFVSTNTATATSPSSDVATRALTLAVAARTGRTPPPAAVLPASPSTAWTHDRLTRLEGYYAGTSSLVKVDATGTGLRLTGRAGTAAEVAFDAEPAADGWFRATNGVQYAVRTVAGRRLLIGRAVLGLRVVQLVVGERLPDRNLGAFWRARLGTYRAVDADPRVDASLVARTLRLRTVGDQVVMELGSEGGMQGLAPGPGRRHLAVTAGLGGGLGRGKGEVLVPVVTRGGPPAFAYFGVTYRRTSA